MFLIFADEPSDSDKLQAKGRLVRESDLSPEERERRRAATVYQIVPSTIDDNLAEVLRKKLKALTRYDERVSKS